MRQMSACSRLHFRLGRAGRVLGPIISRQRDEPSMLHRGELKWLLVALLLGFGLAPAGSAARAPLEGDHWPHTAPGSAGHLAWSAPGGPMHSALVVLEETPVVDRLASAGALDAPLADRLARPGPTSVAAAIKRRTVPPVEVERLDQMLQAHQQPLREALERLGLRVVSRYTAVANALLVHGTAEQLLAAKRLAGVAAVEPAPRFRPLLARSVPHIGASAVAADYGFEGQGSVIAVIDSGIDYTHAAFGGPGTAEAYAAASSAVTVITDTWQGQPLFPAGRVVGGWDFVGSRYTTPELCPPEQAAAGRCTSTPEPDPDPFDEYGHGTMVAGIAAGQETASLARGVAPAASLVALKIYGSAQAGNGIDEAVDVVLDALEWCARVNLGLPVPGVAPDHVDVANLSLGEPYGQAGRQFDAAIARATATGVVVVAAAGNSGNLPYALSAPSASPLALSVASSVPPGQLQLEARWDGVTERYDALEGTVTAPLARMGRLEGQLAWLGQACPGDEPVQDALGRIALVGSGGCSDREKVLYAQSRGARALVAIAGEEGRRVMTGDPTGIALAGVMIDRAPGERLRDLVVSGVTVTAILDPAQENADAIWTLSARGPSVHGALKPDLTAPGAGILSASLGAGSGGSAASGTSAATPHVAGAVALLWQRSRQERLALSAADIGALLMNYSLPGVHPLGAAATSPVAVSRQGAGRLDVYAAVRGRFLARAGALASLHLGERSSNRGQEVLHASVQLHNLTDEEIRLVPSLVLRNPEHAPALQAELPSGVLVAGRETAQLEVSFRLDTGRVPEWTLRGQPRASAEALDRLEIDGWLVLTPSDPLGNPRAGIPAAQVPFRILPRRATRAYLAQWEVPVGSTPGRLVFQNLSPHNGWVELFHVPANGEQGDPDEPEVAGGLDIQYVGVRFDTPASQPSRPELSLAIALHEVATVPQRTSYEVYLDVDRDGRPDFRLRNGTRRALGASPSPDEMAVALGRWDPASQEVTDERIIGPQKADLFTRVTMLSVPIGELGLAEPAPIAFYVVHRGLTEDWLGLPAFDVAPDGALTAPGAWYSYDPAATSYRPESWTVGMAGSALATATLLAGQGHEAVPLLVVFPDNPFEWPDSQAVRVMPGRPGAGPPGPRPAYLPLAVNRERLTPETPTEKMVSEAVKKLAQVTKFRTLYDERDYRHGVDRSAVGQWLYTFNGPELVYIVFSPEAGHPIAEYIRRLTTVWERWEGAERYSCSSRRDRIWLSGDLVAILERDFAGPGWKADQPESGEFSSRPVWRLIRAAPGAGAQERVYIDRETALPLFFSHLEGDVLRPARVLTYTLYDFEDPRIRFRGLNIPCP